LRVRFSWIESLVSGTEVGASRALAAVGRELLPRSRRENGGPPNMVGFVESAGVAAVPYGPDSREAMNPAMDFVRDLPAKMQNPARMLTEVLNVSAGSSRRRARR